jgi:DNA polymerase III epsilon subunit-like protein
MVRSFYFKMLTFDHHVKYKNMYLFFDTETTGLPRNWKAPVSDVNNWPRMVQIAWLLFDMDGKKIEAGNHIIKPEGYFIPPDASRVHGISTQRAIEEGQDLGHVLGLFNDLIKESNFLVAHNISFDEKIVGAEFFRKNILSDLFQKTRLCTMNASTNYCRIPGPYGYKWPKLSELHITLFGNSFEEAHDASVDINATAKCFWKMKELGIV